jgi:propanediol dehydratase large subunit
MHEYQNPETVVGKTCEGEDVTWAKIELAANEVNEWLKLKMTSGSSSTGLVYQLA